MYLLTAALSSFTEAPFFIEIVGVFAAAFVFASGDFFPFNAPLFPDVSVTFAIGNSNLYRLFFHSCFERKAAIEENEVFRLL